MQVTKNKLLQTDIFIDNEYLDKYIEIVTTKNCGYIKGKSNRHHIIPKYYFKDNNLPIDNTDNNIVDLLYKDHILAHYFLARCSALNKDVCRNALSIRFLLNGQTLEEVNISDIDFDYYQHLYEIGRAYNIDSTHTPEVNQKVSNSLLGRTSPNLGNKYAVKKSKKNKNAKNQLLSDYASTRVGSKNPFYGCTHSDKTKSIIGDKNSKSINMIDPNTGRVVNTFKSIKDASEYLQVNGIVSCKCPNSRISKVCRGYGKIAYGFMWKFNDE